MIPELLAPHQDRRAHFPCGHWAVNTLDDPQDKDATRRREALARFRAELQEGQVDLPDNFVALFEAITLFQLELHEAYDQYMQAQTRRWGAVQALNATVKLIEFFEKGGSRLSVPLVITMAALCDLDAGIQSPLLKPAKTGGSGRRPDSISRQAMQGYAAATMELLIRIGHSPDEAGRLVGRILDQDRVHFGGSHQGRTAATVAGWREKFNRAQGANHARFLYQLTIDGYESSQPDSDTSPKGILQALRNAIRGTDQWGSDPI